MLTNNKYYETKRRWRERKKQDREWLDRQNELSRHKYATDEAYREKRKAASLARYNSLKDKPEYKAMRSEKYKERYNNDEDFRMKTRRKHRESYRRVKERNNAKESI